MRFVGPAILLALALAAHASAQVVDDRRFREIEAGFEDLSPNAVSNRMFPVDLRTPYSFERVYEVVGSEGLFARRAGAVTAVFDRSVYAGDATPLVPPGTVFYLGTLPVRLGEPGLLSPRQLPLAPASRWNREQAGSATPVPAGPAMQPLDLRVHADASFQQGPRDLPGSMWSDEAYRVRRVGDILRSAAWTIRELQASDAPVRGSGGGETGPGSGG